MVNESNDEPPETVLEAERIEIHQEADADMTHPEIGQNLGFMRRNERGNSFDFKNDGVFHHHVSAETERKCGSFVNDRHDDLILKFDASLAQLQAQKSRVNRFEKSGSRLAMHLDREADDAFGQVMMRQHVLLRGTPWFSVFSVVSLTKV